MKVFFTNIFLDSWNNIDQNGSKVIEIEANLNVANIERNRGWEYKVSWSQLRKVAAEL